ncbi:SprT-like family domain-containing protein [Trichoderma ceciliae]
MAHTQAYDFYIDSDDELPTVDALLKRLPSRTQYKYSQTRPISSPKQKNTATTISEQRCNSLEIQFPNTVDSSSKSRGKMPERAITSSIRGEIQKEWQSSLEQVGDDICGENTTQPKGLAENTQGSRGKKRGLQPRVKAKNGENLSSRIEFKVSIRRLRSPSETVDEPRITDEAEPKNPCLDDGDSTLRSPRSQHPTMKRFCDGDQEEIVTQHPRNQSLGHAQPMKSNDLGQFLEDENGQDIIRPFSQLRLGHQDPLGRDTLPNLSIMSPKNCKQKGLVSPHGAVHIKDIPHEASLKTLRHQEPDNDQDEPLIPRKPSSAQCKVPKTTSPKKQTKKLFDAKKCQLATDFLQQLDTQITHGKIGELTEPTGGVNIVWSNTLKTTAGRANWRRETVSSKQTSDNARMDVRQYRHHSSIELAEKIINDEQRLFNVIAHEFCHLANFMINGITDNPHGKEFKVWAAKCSQSFGSQGIEVTTKHTYEIDFKYVWVCTACGCEYKRHSKSIDPQRHRCGACKASLEQTRPTPRQTPPMGKLSEYQLFVQEQMKMVRSENPNRPQKEIMRIIAEKWAKVKNGHA